MLSDSAETSIALSFHVVELFRLSPAQKLFKVLDEGYLLILRKSRIAFASPLGEERAYKIVVPGPCHIYRLCLTLVIDALRQGPIFKAAIEKETPDLYWLALALRI